MEAGTVTRGQREAAVRAVMEARVKWGWTFGKRPRVMAIDELMVDAVIGALTGH